MPPSNERQELSLNDAATHVLEECRTVVPGMQALFGFQLIAVFSTVFRDELRPSERVIHFSAILMVSIASVVLSMAGRSRRCAVIFACRTPLISASQLAQPTWRSRLYSPAASVRISTGKVAKA